MHDPDELNKLFIIGNGFDLSLGLKTKYEDFIYTLFYNTLHDAIYSETKQINGSKLGYGTSHGSASINGFAENSFMSITILTKYAFKPDDLKKRFRDLKPFLEEFTKSDQINIKIKNSILKETFLNLTENWVDMEGVYFELLKTQLKIGFMANEETKLQPDRNKDFWKKIKSNVQRLNNELKEISDKLKEYLLGDISTKGLNHQIDEHIPIFKRPVVETDGTTHKAAAIHLLNFNYTNTIERCCDPIEFQINRIHGTLDEEIIFGYGDEMDKVYKEIEELNENSFFEHIKSFGYFRNDRYRKLLGFMAHSPFQVNIYGHSCGLSDRVLLNEIFEHENCHSIRVYHIGEKDYINKTMEISRHFNSNQLLRNRILPYNPEDFIPQKSGV